MIEAKDLLQKAPLHYGIYAAGEVTPGMLCGYVRIVTGNKEWEMPPNPDEDPDFGMQRISRVTLTPFIRFLTAQIFAKYLARAEYEASFYPRAEFFAGLEIKPPALIIRVIDMASPTFALGKILDRFHAKWPAIGPFLAIPCSASFLTVNPLAEP